MLETIVKPREVEEQIIKPGKETGMKSYVLFTVSGPMVILTNYNSVDNPGCLEMLRSRGFHKFIAHEIQLDVAKTRYGGHFGAVCNDPNEDDRLRILDYKSERAIKLFSFREMGPPIYYEYDNDSFAVNRLTDYESEYLRVYPKAG